MTLDRRAHASEMRKLENSETWEHSEYRNASLCENAAESLAELRAQRDRKIITEQRQIRPLTSIISRIQMQKGQLRRSCTKIVLNEGPNWPLTHLPISPSIDFSNECFLPPFS